MSYVEKHTAGSPTDESVKWTHLRPVDIAIHLKQTHDIVVSHGCIKRVLSSHDYCKQIGRAHV